jgi:hypothetical protein
MKIVVGQIYKPPGASRPISQHMQIWLGDRLSALATPTPEFLRKYGADFTLIVRVSARSNCANNQIKGPTVFKNSKDVEYTLFLPYDAIIADEGGCRTAMRFLLNGIQEVFTLAHILAEGFEEKKASIVEVVCSDPAMLKKPWRSV